MSAVDLERGLSADGAFGAPREDEPSVDLTAIIAREALVGVPPPEAAGANPTAGFLAITREGDRNYSPGDALGSVARCARDVAEHVRELSEEGAWVYRPARWARTEHGRVLDRALAAAGLEVRSLASALPRGPLLVVDEANLLAKVEDGPLERVSAHGQAASLAAGLAPHVARRMVELAEAEEVWSNGYTDFARSVVVQNLERLLVEGILREAPFRLGGESAPVFCALPEATELLEPRLREELAAASAENTKVADAPHRARSTTTRAHRTCAAPLLPRGARGPAAPRQRAKLVRKTR